jgi:hypothetical protein
MWKLYYNLSMRSNFGLNLKITSMDILCERVSEVISSVTCYIFIGEKNVSKKPLKRKTKRTRNFYTQVTHSVSIAVVELIKGKESIMLWLLYDRSKS